jgi:hypothetical protein
MPDGAGAGAGTAQAWGTRQDSTDMPGSKLPRYLVYVLALGIAVGAIMLSMFYGQYRWLATGMVEDSAADHEAYLRISLEARGREQLTHYPPRACPADRCGPAARWHSIRR